jgi:hypothetical protein
MTNKSRSFDCCSLNVHRSAKDPKLAQRLGRPPKTGGPLATYKAPEPCPSQCHDRLDRVHDLVERLFGAPVQSLGRR